MMNPADPARRLLEAYDTCAALDGGAREAYLTALARENAALVAKLRAMLSFEPDARDAGTLGVESLVGELAGAGMVSVADAPAEPRIVGGFTVQRLLGRGGMGEVWLAEREHDGFRQQVALKRLRSGRDSEDLRRRFVQERRILAELSHPGIARFIDGGVDEAGAPWYAMEYVQGVPITEHVRARDIDVRARVALVAEVAEAVAYAQNRLVVHRDLKPSNILVDANGVPHLLDFGIAKLLEGMPDDGETATGLRAMSPSYAAPEQVLGEPISTATDVYALGAVLYELLTGTLPHAREAVTLEALADRVRNETIQRPSARLRATTATGRIAAETQRTLRAVSGEVDAIVLTALRREPERRYASAAAFADDLRRWLDGRPVRAQSDTATYRLRKFVARNRLAVGSASAVLLALIAGFGVAMWQAGVARAEAARANAAVLEARRASQEATLMNRFLSDHLIDSSPVQSAVGRKLTLTDWVKSALTKLDTELADAPQARSALRNTFGAALRELGDPEASLPVLQRSLAESMEINPNSIDTAVSHHSIGATLNRLGRLTEARAELTTAIALLDALPPTEEVRLTRVRALTTLLRIASAEDRTAEMLAIAERNIAERGALYGVDDSRLAVDYNNLAQALIRVGRIADAEIATRRSRDLLLAGGSAPPARLAVIEQTICVLNTQRAAWPDAHAACQRADALCVDALGSAHDSCIGIRATMANAYFHAGDESTARRLYAELRPAALASTVPSIKAVPLRIGLHLAVIDQDWARLAVEADQLIAALPTVEDPNRLTFRSLADTFAALAAWRSTRAAGAREATLDAADALLADNESSVFVTATAALAAYLALDRADDAEAASQWRARGIERLARAMPVVEAENVWQRWLPHAASR